VLLWLAESLLACCWLAAERALPEVGAWNEALADCWAPKQQNNDERKPRCRLFFDVAVV